MGQARDLYDDLVRRGEAAINEMVSQKRQENLWLEFKMAEKNSAPMQQKDLQNFAKSVSAFANSEGGVIVWGVEANNAGNSEEPDAARKLAPIEKLSTWLTDLDSRTATLYTPAVPVEHFALPMGRKTDKGYDVSFVPKSDGLPVMAMATGQHRYYIRAGSSTIKMEHYMLADRFSRRPPPKLRVSVTHDALQPSEFLIGIENIGRGIALYPAISISSLTGLELSPSTLSLGQRYGLPTFLQSIDPNKPSWTFAGGADDVVYPELGRLVVRLRTHYDLDDDRHQGLEVSFSCKVMCDGYFGSGRVIINFNREISGQTSLVELPSVS